MHKFYVHVDTHINVLQRCGQLGKTNLCTFLRQGGGGANLPKWGHLCIIPPAYEVRGKVMFWHESVCPHLWGGGTPSSRSGGYPIPGPGGGYPFNWQGGYSIPREEGVSLVPPWIHRCCDFKLSNRTKWRLRLVMYEGLNRKEIILRFSWTRKAFDFRKTLGFLPSIRKLVNSLFGVWVVKCNRKSVE